MALTNSKICPRKIPKFSGHPKNTQHILDHPKLRIMMRAGLSTLLYRSQGRGPVSSLIGPGALMPKSFLTKPMLWAPQKIATYFGPPQTTCFHVRRPCPIEALYKAL